MNFISLESQCFPRREILGKQNSLFPSGPVIKSLPGAGQARETWNPSLLLQLYLIIEDCLVVQFKQIFNKFILVLLELFFRGVRDKNVDQGALRSGRMVGQYS